MQKRQVWSLAGEALLEEEMATHSRIPAWENSMDRVSWWAVVHRVSSVGHDWGNEHTNIFSSSHVWTWQLDDKEGWTPNNWGWRRLLRVLWTAKRSKQSVLKNINPEYWLEELLLKLKLQYSGHLMGRADSLEKTLKLERLRVKGEGGSGRGWDG